MDINTLRAFCDNIYSHENIIKFEQILLNKLDWQPYLPTSKEVLYQFKDFLLKICLDSSANNDEDYITLLSLSEIFNSEEFTEKASVFVQVAILGTHINL